MEPKKDIQKGYTALDVAALAGIAVISGAIFLIASNYIYLPLVGASAVYPFIAVTWPAMYGFWFIGATAAAYLIRKPGSAFAGELVGSLVEMVLGSYFAIYSVLWGILQGIASEIGFAIFRYKRWDYLSMSVAGSLPGIAAVIPGFYLFPELYIAAYNVAGYLGIFGYIILHIISGLIIAGILTKIVIDGLARTGIFDLFEVGREIKK